MRDIFFNPYFEYNKTPQGAVKINTPIIMRISFQQSYNIWNLSIVLKSDSKGIEKVFPLFYEKTDFYNVFKVEFSLEEADIYWYYFKFEDCYGTHYVCCDINMDAILTDEITYSFQLSIHNGFKKDLRWFKGGVMYQIMPDRFCNLDNNYCHDGGWMHKSFDEHPAYLPVHGRILNNDYFGGNIKGIISKLDYIKDLGVKAIYLNPISLAYSNHRYDTADYLELDPMLGTEEDFKKLCEEAKLRKIGIIIDGVFNHTGSNSRYFNRDNKFDELGAYQSKDSKYYNWYKFIEWPNKYWSWWGFDTLPSINQKSSFVDFVCEKVIPKWIGLGASGYRLDVVDELNNEFVERISKAVKKANPKAILIGEVWEDASNKEAYGYRKHYFDGKELDSVMNYPFRKAIIEYVCFGSVYNLRNTLRSIINNYPKEVLDSLMNILGTHDTERILSVCGNISFHNMDRVEIANFRMDKALYNDAIKRLKMCAVLQYTLPGVPCIYYGDETGMEGYKDPYCRKPFPWNNINKDLHDFYVKLGKIRNENKDFVGGKYKEIYADAGQLAFRRGDSIYELVNNSNEIAYYDIDAIDLMSGEHNTHFGIYPHTARILKRCL